MSKDEVNKIVVAFCQSFIVDGDLERAGRAAVDTGQHLGPLDTFYTIGEKLLNKPEVQDYLTLLGDGVAVDDIIERLGAVRRQALRKGDHKTMKDAEVEISKLKGHTRPEAFTDEVRRIEVVVEFVEKVTQL